MAIIEAYRQFGFIGESRQADFYFSLPVSRRTLFCERYLSGIACVMLPFMGNILLGMINSSLLGASFVVLRYILLGMIIEFIIFVHFYTISVFLCMLTVKKIIYGCSVLMFNLIGGLGYLYLHTVIDPVNPVFDEKLQKLTEISPLVQYLNVLTDYRPVHTSVNGERYEYLIRLSGLQWILPACFFITLLFLLLALRLFLRIRSERGSKTMQFGKTERPVQLIISVMFGTLLGAVFPAVYGSVGIILQVIAVSAVSVLLIHSIFEIVYTGDHRKIFRHKWQLVICMLLAVMGALQPVL